MTVRYFLYLLTPFLLNGCHADIECLSQYSNRGEDYYSGRTWTSIGAYKEVGELFADNAEIPGKDRPVLFVEVDGMRIPMESRTIGPVNGIRDYFGYAIPTGGSKQIGADSTIGLINEGYELLSMGAIEHVYFELPLHGPINKEEIEESIGRIFDLVCESDSFRASTSGPFWPIVLFDRSRPIPPPPRPFSDHSGEAQPGPSAAGE